jgi:AraC-like DNA-binding protein
MAKGTHYKKFTPEEDEQMLDLASRHDLRTVAERMHCSERRLRHRFGQLRASVLDKDWFTMADAALVLGVDRRWVRTRIDSGAIRAEEHYTGATNRPKAHHIGRDDLASFIRRFPTEIQGRKADMVAVVDLLTE